jgi:flagellar motility protein MotE (MotC chaperone)
MRNFLLIVAVGAISGTVGAMGNAYFFGKQAGDRSEAEKRSAGKSSAETTSDQSAQTQANESSKAAQSAAPIPGIGSAQEVEELKQQIRNLNQRIAGLNERVDRLQDLLSLAVPLLQRLAPKS